MPCRTKSDGYIIAMTSVKEFVNEHIFSKSVGLTRLNNLL